jgi:hypothetical protein
MVTSLDRPETILLCSLWQVCLRSTRTSEDDLSTKTVPGDDNDKNWPLIGLNIQITELYVKQKGRLNQDSISLTRWPQNQHFLSFDPLGSGQNSG